MRNTYHRLNQNCGASQPIDIASIRSYLIFIRVSDSVPRVGGAAVKEEHIIDLLRGFRSRYLEQKSSNVTAKPLTARNSPIDASFETEFRYVMISVPSKSFVFRVVLELFALEKKKVGGNISIQSMECFHSPVCNRFRLVWINSNDIGY
jgi:hypothetical protein